MKMKIILLAFGLCLSLSLTRSALADDWSFSGQSFDGQGNGQDDFTCVANVCSGG
jgi:hypothetical protein